MVLINGRKFACDACIRGHRASSCSHTGRQLLPVRRKGRPSSQCSACKAKRVAGSFHGKCHCDATSDGRSSSRSASSAEEDDKLCNVGIAEEGTKGRHSLESLMNPCRCKTTGICTCCKTDVNQENAVDQDLQLDSGAACCNGQDCCSDDTLKPICSSSSLPKSNKSCCSGTIDNDSHAAVSLFSPQAGLTRDEIEAIMSPTCQCGENCTCPGCVNKDQLSLEGAKKIEECPEKCLTCSACAFGLTRPSGIDVIDEWMEKDMESRKHSYIGKELSEISNKRTKLLKDQLPPPMHHPPLPPFATASSFFKSHFLDSERRNHFAEQMQGTESNLQSAQFSDDRKFPDQEAKFGQRLSGETDEDWQIRHGFYYLTPDAIRIFDKSRKFKDERQQLEEQEERLERSANSSESLASSGPNVLSQELTDLRRKALSARKKPSNACTNCTIVIRSSSFGLRWKGRAATSPDYHHSRPLTIPGPRAALTSSPMPSTFSFLKSSVQNRRASNNYPDTSRSASITAPSSTTTASSSNSSSTTNDLASDKFVVSDDNRNAQAHTKSQRKFPPLSIANSEVDPRDPLPSIDITSPSSDQPKNLWTPGKEETSFNFTPTSPQKRERKNSAPDSSSSHSNSSEEDHLYSLRTMPRSLSVNSKKDEATSPKKARKAEVPDRHDVMRRAMADATSSDAFGSLSNDSAMDAPLQGAAKIPASVSNGSVLDHGSVEHGEASEADKIGEGSLTFDHFTSSPGEGEVVHADGTSNVLEGKPGQPRMPSVAPSEGGQDALYTDSPAQSNFSAPNSAAERSQSISGPPSSVTGHGRYATTGHDLEGARQNSLVVPGSAGSDGRRGSSKQMHESATTGNIPSPLHRLRKLSDSGSSHGKIKPGGGIAGALAASGMTGMGVGHAASLQAQGSLSPTKERSRSRTSSVAADYIASYRGGEASIDDDGSHRKRYHRDRSMTRSSSDMSVGSGLDAAAQFSASSAQNGLQGADNSMRRLSDAPPLTPGGIGAVGGLSPSGAGERVTLGDEEGWPGDMGAQITGFAVASSKRNSDFHNLFTSVPEDDYLIEDYGCALVREILIQGRLYVSENHICFYANIFGWVTNIVLPFSEIVSIEKRMTAYVIPNAIQIATLHSKQTFASFLSRDTTYDLIVNIWKLSHPGVPTGEHAAEMMTDEESDHEADHDGDKGNDDASQTKRSTKSKLKRKLGIIKGDNNSTLANGSGGDSAAQNDSGISRSKSPSAQSNKKGPHRKTECPCDKDKKHYSTIALDTTYPAVPEKLYNLMFTSGFMKEFWTDNQKLLELHLSDWAPNPESDDLLSRNITYIKPLTGSFGPKQTKCHLTEQNLHVDFDEYVTALTTTKTPDVPSGGSFSVKTKTCLTWAGGNVTKVHVTCQVDWTGRSMVKGIIDRASIDGQKQYYKDLDVAIRKYMKDHSSEFREEGDDESTSAVIESQTESGIDSQEGKDREGEGSATPSDSEAKDGMAKFLDIASETASTAFGFVSDLVGGTSLSVLILGAVVFLLVISNLWAIKSPSSRDPLDPHTLRKSTHHKNKMHHESETAQYVAIAVREVLQDYFDPTSKAIMAAGRVSGENQTPRLTFDDPIEEMNSLLALLDNVEGRISQLRDQLKSVSAGQSSASGNR